MKKICCIALWLLLAGYGSAQNINKTIQVDGLTRHYILHLPPAFGTAQKLPLILALHGGGGTAEGAVRLYHLESLGDKNQFIIVYPDAVNKAWRIPGMTSRVKRADTTVDDVRFISLLLDTLIAHYKVNAAKVYCTGLSRGAMFSFYLAAALNDRIAAIAPVCGGISQTVAATYAFKKPMPVLMINGTADPLVNYDGGFGNMNRRNEGDEAADLLPAEELVKKLVAMNHCDGQPRIIALPDADASDGCTETEAIYQCNKAIIDFIKIENGGHTWPGGTQYLPKFIIGRLCNDFSASQKIFDFFTAQ